MEIMINRECMETQLLGIVNKLQMKIIADSIMKVEEISMQTLNRSSGLDIGMKYGEYSDYSHSNSNHSILNFKVTFEHGLMVSSAVFP